MKRIIIFCFAVVFAYTLQAETWVAVYAQFLNSPETSPGLSVEELKQAYSEQTNLQFAGYYKTIHTEKEYAFSADTSTKKNKFNISGSDAWYYDLVNKKSFRPGLDFSKGFDNLEPVIQESDYTQPEWIIEQDTQTINGFLCQKARVKVSPEEEATEPQITAWFCKDIPYATGPDGNWGLPGIIVNLEFRNSSLAFIYSFVLQSYYTLPDANPIKIILPKGKRVGSDVPIVIPRTRVVTN